MATAALDVPVAGRPVAPPAVVVAVVVVVVAAVVVVVVVGGGAMAQAALVKVLESSVTAPLRAINRPAIFGSARA